MDCINESNSRKGMNKLDDRQSREVEGTNILCQSHIKNVARDEIEEIWTD